MNETKDDRNDRHPDELLSLYVDGELDGDRRRRVEGHLETCRDCREIVRDLEEVVARVSELPGREPPRNYWPGIAEAIESDASGEAGSQEDGDASVVPLFRPESRFRLPRLAAAAALVAVLAAGVTWTITQSEAGDAGAVRVASSDSPAATPSGEGGSVRFAALGAGAESVDRLEAQYREARDELDPETRRMFDRNLDLIDRAMEQARQELSEHPDNLYVQQHLTQILSRKARFLAMALQLTDTG